MRTRAHGRAATRELNDMSENDEKPSEKRKNWPESGEDKSDKRTAEFVVRRIGEAQERLADLIAEMRTFEHYSEIEDLGFCLRILQRLKKQYRDFAERGVWED
jgi:hypothetical protein